MGKTLEAALEGPQAHLPLLRYVGIRANELTKLQTDIPVSKLSNGGWVEASPETAGGMSAIGYYFASRVQRALQIPIGIIDNARGGASIESLVPAHKFDDHPIAKRYAKSVAKRQAGFSMEADLGNPEHTAFLSAYDIRIPGLHPLKKRAHGERAARWALNRVYDIRTPDFGGVLGEFMMIPI